MNTANQVLDEEDLALIHALQIGPRLPWTTLGEVLERHPTAVAARWRRLEEAGLAWLAVHPRGDPERVTLSFHDVRCEPSERRGVVSALAEIPEVFTIEECYRDRDLMLTTATSSQATLAQTVYRQLDRIPGLLRYETAFCTRLHASGGDWELDALGADQRRALRAAAGPRPGPSRDPDRARLPESYRPIVQALGRNARATAAQIAQETGLHPATARRRLQAALDSQTLSFRAELAPHRAGYPVLCQWFARLPAADHEFAATTLASTGALRLCASTTGRTNFTFLMWLRSAAEIMTVEQTVTREVPRLDLRESVIIANNSKRVGWLLNPDGTRTGGYRAPAAAWG